MGCRTLTNGEQCCFYCSTTGVAFGPIMPDGLEGLFLKHCEPRDPREIPVNELIVMWGKWASSREELAERCRQWIRNHPVTQKDKLAEDVARIAISELEAPTDEPFLIELACWIEDQNG